MTDSRKKAASFPTWLLKKMFASTLREGYSGDIEEEYGIICKNENKLKANLWIWGEAIKSLPTFLKFYLSGSAAMFMNYFKVAFRNLIKQKLYSLINISGLGIGMASVILITLFIFDEISYDRYHKKADRIYRLTKSRTGEAIPDFVGTQPPVAPALKDKFPEMEDYVRFDPFLFRNKHLLKYGDRIFYEQRFVLADPSLFNVFDFKLLKGDPETVLDEPSDLVITKTMSEKYFGKKDPIGKTILYNNNINFIISGVMEDVPENSHFKFDFVGSFKFINKIKGSENRDLLASWGQSNYYTYILLKENVEPKNFQEKSSVFLREMTENPDLNIYLQPITDIHLRSKIVKDPEPHGNILNVYLYSAIAIIILLIACINFMNLYTANSETRLKEVGMRKVLGALKSQLILQFLSEAVIITIIAVPLALLLVEFVLPSFNTITGKTIAIDYATNFGFYAGLILLAITVGLLSGSYPAFFISSLQPIKIISGKLQTVKKTFNFRNILVVFQFSISVIFIVGSLIINNQMQFIRSKDLGYNRENILNVPMYSSETKLNYQTFKTEINRNPNIITTTASSYTPSIERWRQGEYFEGRKETDDHMFFRMACDYNYFELFKMEFIAGRNFDKNFPTDDKKAWILNESAVADIGWNPDQAIGKAFGNEDDPGTVIGVVKDFNFRSLRYETKPMAINIIPSSFNYISIKIKPEEISGTIAFIQDKWQNLNPNFPFEFYFYDDEFDKLYKSDIKLQVMFQYFTYFAIFIACLGLFGLSMFTVKQRTKEICIRKVLGANFAKTSSILTRDFFKLIFVSYIIAVPISYLIMNRWLQDFTYRVNFSAGTLIISALTVIIITLVTISFQVVKVSFANPASVLKDE